MESIKLSQLPRNPNNDKLPQIREMYKRIQKEREEDRARASRSKNPTEDFLKVRNRKLITCSIKVLKVNFRCRSPLNLLLDISSVRRPSELVILIYLSFRDSTGPERLRIYKFSTN